MRFKSLFLVALMTNLTVCHGIAMAADNDKVKKEVREIDITKLGGMSLGTNYVKPAQKKQLNKEEQDIANYVSKDEIDINKSNRKTIILGKPAASVKFSFPNDKKHQVFVNGNLIDSDKIGKRNQSKNKKIVTYYGLELETGENSIDAVAINKETNEFEKKYTVKVFVRGNVDKIEIPTVKVPADGRSKVKTKIKLIDKWGNPVIDGQLVNVKINKGQIITPDDDRNLEGIQLLTKDGFVEVEILSSTTVDTGILEAEQNLVKGQGEVNFTTPHRKPIFLGVVNSNTGYSFVDGKTFDDDPKAIFENGNDLLNNGKTLIDDDVSKQGIKYNIGASLFTQGTVFEDYLFTLAFDTRNKLNALEDERNILFRDRAEDRLYPTYGDSSQLNQIALSNSNVFFKLENGKSHLMWGDFSTGANRIDTLTPRMSNYNRVFTGANLKLDNNNTYLNAFGAMSRQAFNRDEIRGAGVSGPYFSSKFPMVNGTERIMIETRDRLVEGTILKTRTLNRLSDYNIDYNTGSIVFSEPVQSFDDNLNPNYIVIVYEYFPQDFNNSVVGVNFEQNLIGGASVGGSYVREISESQPYQLIGLNVKEKINEQFSLLGEFSNSFFENKYGNAYRVALQADPIENLNINGEYQYVDDNFSNRTASSFQPNSQRYTLNARYSPFQSTQLNLGLNHNNTFTDDRILQTVDFKVGQGLFEHFVDLGIQGRRFNNQGTDDTMQSALLFNAGYRTPTFYGMSFNISRSQNILDTVDQSSPTRTTLGVDYQVLSNVKVFAKQNFLERQDPQSKENKIGTATVVGVDTGFKNTDSDFLNALNVGAKYQIDGVIDGRSAQSRIGLNNRLAVLPGLNLGVAYERVQGANPLTNVGQDHNAWSLSADYSPQNIGVRTSIKYDFRDGDNASNLISWNAAGAIGDDFGLFGRLSYATSSQATRRNNTQGLFGLAYRPIESDFFNALFKYQLKKRLEGLNQLSDITNHILAFEGFFQPHYRWEIFTKLALKNSLDQTEGFDPVTSNIGLGLARFTYKVNYNFDLVGEFRNLTQFETLTSNNDFTGEIGYFPVKDLRVGLGYNFFGYSDVDLVTSNYRSQGPYINLTFKMSQLAEIWGQENIITKKDLLEIKKK